MAGYECHGALWTYTAEEGGMIRKMSKAIGESGRVDDSERRCLNAVVCSRCLPKRIQG
jgi:hypothetical protein